MKKTFLSALCLLAGFTMFAQGLTQSIVGRVLDNVSETPLPGVNVIVLDTDPVLSASTDGEGYFKIAGVPVGRVSVQFSFVGYKVVTLNDLNLMSGKSLSLNPKLEESVVELEKVEIVANGKRDEAMNKMATVSARAISMEETNRYAGSLGDPSRMAQNFAGVNFGADNRNDIIIRGNSPSGLLWKLDGVAIPSPNHFSSQGSTGGPVSMLNNNLLSNCDFFTGAWPAEYGNSITGVFDLKMKNGNVEKREYLGQVGWSGFELGAEGPFVKGKRASYVINYRYSTMAFVEKLGFNGIGITPYYQDLSTKINVPTAKFGTFSLTGIAGLSNIDLMHTESSNYGNDTIIDIYTGSQMATGILAHNYQISGNTSVRTYFASSAVNTYTDVDCILYKQHADGSWSDEGASPFLKNSNVEIRNQIGTKVTHKFNAKNNINFGGNAQMFSVDAQDSSLKDVEFYQFATDTNFAQSTQYERNTDTKESGLMLYQGFIQWQHRFNEQLSLYAGVNGQFFQYNNTWSIDPRASIKYQFTDRQSVKFGYGYHSQLQPMFLYLTQSTNDYKTYTLSNKDLDFTKSHHFVAGYDIQLAKDWRFKTELYYQYLFDVPVMKINDFLVAHKDDPAYRDEYLERASVSLSNYGADFYMPRFDSLVNEGTGRNYGVELTVEKSFSHGFYALTTLSLFQSKYKTPHSEELNTVFNNNVVFNALGGYEYKLNQRRSFGVDVKGTVSGGRRRLDIDLERSIAEGNGMYNYEKPYETQYRPYFRFDIKISTKANYKHFTEEFSIDFQNVTNHNNMMMEQFSYNRINPEQSKVIEVPQMGFFVMPTYRIVF